MSIRDLYSKLGMAIPEHYGSTEATAEFHQRVILAGEKLRSAIEAASKINPDLKDSVRLQKQKVAVIKAKAEFKREVTAAARPLQVAVSSVREELSKAARGPEAGDGALERLLHFHQVQELRRQIEAIPVTERGRALDTLAASGNPYVLEALDGSLVPLTGQPVIDAVRSTYLRATQKPLIQRMEAAEEGEGEVLTILRQSDGLVDRTARSYGLEDALHSPALNYAESLTNEQKAQIISIHGRDAFQNLVMTGEIPSWRKEHSLERHPEASTFEELVHQVGSPEAAITWIVEKKLPEDWNPPEE